MKRLILSTLALSLLFSSCNDTSVKKEKDPTPTSSSPVEKGETNDITINKQYFELKAAVDESWGYLDKIEEDKFFTMERLLKEVSYNPRHKGSRLKEEQTKIDLLKQQKPNPQTLINLDNIDAYDVVSNTTISSLSQLVDETKGMEQYPLAQELLNDLDSLNNGATISYRSLYGQTVLEYNKFVKENKEGLETTGVKDIDTIPGFFTE